MPMTMMSPMKDATLKVIPVTNRARTTPDMERMEEVRIATGADRWGNSGAGTPQGGARGRREIAELGEENAEDEGEGEEKHAFEFGEGLLLFFVGAAVLNTHAGREV